MEEKNLWIIYSYQIEIKFHKIINSNTQRLMLPLTLNNHFNSIDQRKNDWIKQTLWLIENQHWSIIQIDQSINKDKIG
jgi:hypothetical protein